MPAAGIAHPPSQLINEYTKENRLVEVLNEFSFKQKSLKLFFDEAKRNSPIINAFKKLVVERARPQGKLEG